MKKLLVIAAALCIGASTAKAEWTNEIVHHIPSYRMVTFTNVSAGGTTAGFTSATADSYATAGTAVSTNVAYILIPVASVNFLTEAQASHSAVTNNGASWKSLTFGLVDTLFEQYDGLASTDQASKQRLTRTVRTVSGSDLKFTHTIETDVNIGSASTVADE